MKTSHSRSSQFVFGIFFGLWLSLSGCDFSCAPLAQNATTQLTPLQHFTFKVEQKYKRYDTNNDIDLHFFCLNEHSVKVKVTFKTIEQQSLAESIAEAAMDHYKHLAREEDSVKGIDFSIEKEVSMRPKEE